MARKLMKNIDGERLRFSATFVRYGSKRAFRGPDLTTLLLRDIRRVDTGEVVADHIWFTTNKTFETAEAGLGGFREGDAFEFDARVKTYLKGYRGYREDVDKPVELDYKLSHPTKVVVVRPGVVANP